MKKLTLALLLTLLLLATGCGSSNVADYTGGEQEQTAAEETQEQNEKEEAPEETEATETPVNENPYTVAVEKFDVYASSFDDGYRFDAIVSVRNDGDKSIYLSGTAFDVEDANGSLIKSDDMLSSCPDIIKPGETGYLYNDFGTSLGDVSDPASIKLVPQYVIKTTEKQLAEYDISDVSLKDDEYFGVSAVGRVTNNTDKDDSTVIISIVYFGQDGKVIGIDSTTVSDLIAGRTVSFETSGMNLPDGLTTSSIADYKVIAREIFWGF